MKENKEFANDVNRLIKAHQKACKKANAHCIYSDKVYNESCIRCFANWILDTNKVVLIGQEKDSID